MGSTWQRGRVPTIFDEPVLSHKGIMFRSQPVLTLLYPVDKHGKLHPT